MRTGFHSILEARLVSLILFVQTEGLFHIFIKPECLETGMQEDLKRELGDITNRNNTGK